MDERVSMNVVERRSAVALATLLTGDDPLTLARVARRTAEATPR